MPEPFSVVAFAGSLRRGSYNRALAAAVRDLAPRSLAVTVHEIDGIPLYNMDLERAAFPAAVTRLKDALRAADGTIIVTPEHNFSLSGVLKNTIDWISRPSGDAPLGGKPIGIMGATSGVTGTARAQMHLRTILVNLNAVVMPQPAVLIARAQDKFDAGGGLTDEETRERVRRFLDAFARWIALIGRKDLPEG